MARGFFDAVNDYTKSGYGAFQNQSYSPEELAQLYAVANQNQGGGQYGTLHERLGANAVGFLGALAGKFMPKKKGPSGEAGKIATQEIQQRAAEIMRDEQLDFSAAHTKAAEEYYAGTADITQAARFRDKARQAAIGVAAEAKAFGGEDTKTKTGTFMPKTFFNVKTGERTRIDSRDPKSAAPVMGANANDWVELPPGTDILWKDDPTDPKKEIPYIVVGNESIPISGAMPRTRRQDNISLSVENPNIVEMLGDKDKSNEIVTLRTKVDNVRGVAELTTRIVDLIHANPNSLGTTADIVRTAVNVGQTVKNMYELANKGRKISERDDPNLLERWVEMAGDNYELIESTGLYSRMKALNVPAQAIKSLYVSLAYIKAKSNNPDGRIATSDFESAMKEIGGNMSEPRAMEAVLRESAKTAVRQAYSWMETSPLYQDEKYRGELDRYVENTLGPYARQYGVISYDDPELSPEDAALISKYAGQ